MDDVISKQTVIGALMELNVARDNPHSYSHFYYMEYCPLETPKPKDIVEVVRCGECKHRYVDGGNVRYNVCDLNHNKVQGDDWFCADGERNDG